MLGYLQVRPGPTSELLDWLHSDLVTYAEREGFALADVFVERADSGRAALSGLVEALKHQEIGAVVVPALEHLSGFPGGRQALRLLIERDTGARVHVVYPNGSG
ncbi:MAG: hypothetical protein DLM59_17505 [Pseudonocardiales bacterium]|nr:MAG: hypothetical protein DLM59_17505 [Pseudonocardiales bacterium]